MGTGLSAGTAEVGPVRLHYLEAGDGPLVLCLHGFPDHAPTMRPLLEHLAAAGLRAVAPFMRGYAPSTVEATTYETAALAADALGLASVLAGGDPVRLVGHDWGGVAALHAAAWQPERVDRVVSISMPHARAFAQALRRDPAQLRRSWYEFLFLAEGFSERVLGDDDFAFVRRLVDDWSPGGGVFAPGEWAALTRTLSAPGVVSAALGYYRSAFQPARRDAAYADGAARWADPVTVPALCIVGADDGCIAADVSRGQDAHFTGGYRLEVIEGAGHWPHREAADVVEPMIAGFLTA